MNDLTPIITRVHEALSTIGDWRVTLPAIVAIGGQSSGKSSVLESIIQKDFLPRGVGIVTRRPLELQLCNIGKQAAIDLRDLAEREGGSVGAGPDGCVDWAEFAHRPSQKYYNFADVRAEISRETERAAGKNKGVLADPIGLRIYSTRVPDLLIVDLPGITKVPVGDQPLDIEAQIREICLAYVRQPNTIILAISPANADIANSDAMKLALEVDPTGERTIGVLTKLDLMDPGTNAVDVLAGRVVHLRRGFVPVVCRSQKDIADNMPIDRALQRERLFFERNPAYRAFAVRCGAPYLSRVLYTMLFNAVRAWLPQVRTEISLMTQAAEQQYRDLGDPVESGDAASQTHLLLRLLSRFAANFCDMIDGRVQADHESDDLLTAQMFGGARIQEVIRSRFYCATAEWLAAFKRNDPPILPDEEILMALRNSSGPRPALFVPEQAFLALVRRHIKSLRELGRKFVDSVYDELRRVADMCEPPGLLRFGDLREKAVEVVQSLLRRAYTPTIEQVDRLVEFELSHINTLHPDFIGADGALAEVEAMGPLQLFRDQRSAASAAGPSAVVLPPYEPALEDGAGAGAAGQASEAEEDDTYDEVPVGGGGWRSRAGSRASSRGGSSVGGDEDPGSRSGVAGTEGGTGSEAGPVPADVAWAMRRMREGAAARRRPGSSSGRAAAAAAAAAASIEEAAAEQRRGVAALHNQSRGAPAAAAPWALDPYSAASAANKFVTDIGERFAPHIVDLIAGYGPADPLPDGVLRVGGPHSPFVAKQRAVNGTSSGGLGPTSPGAYRRSGAGQSSPFGALGGSPLRGPGPFSGEHASHRVISGGGFASAAAAAAEGHSAGADARRYVHLQLATMQSRPLPSVITPQDLRATPREALEIRAIRLLVLSYLSIVRKTYEDMVPKIVISMLVSRAKDDIHSELVRRLYSDITNVDSLLRESEDAAARRRELREQISGLQHAAAILNEVREGGGNLHGAVGAMHSTGLLGSSSPAGGLMYFGAPRDANPSPLMGDSSGGLNSLMGGGPELESAASRPARANIGHALPRKASPALGLGAMVGGALGPVAPVLSAGGV